MFHTRILAAAAFMAMLAAAPANAAESGLIHRLMQVIHHVLADSDTVWRG